MDAAKGCTCLMVSLGFVTCAKDHSTITIGSKNFIDQMLLGEIVAQPLEQRLGRPVRRKLNLSGMILTHRALITGEIDLYSEYTGTALTAILQLPPSTDATALLGRVRDESRTRFGVQWPDPLGFNNTFAMMIRRSDAQRCHIESLTDASRYAPGWCLGVGYEFQQRPDGLSKLISTYHLLLIGTPKTTNLGLLYQALEQRDGNTVAGNSTDGLLAALDVAVLHDDHGCFPAYQAALLVRNDALQREPILEQALRERSGRFTDEIIRTLNHQVILRRGNMQEVAKQFLQGSGALK